MNIFAKYCTFLNLRSHVVTQMTLQFSTNRRESPIRGGKLMVYKTASDTLNYVSERCIDVDFTATAVIFLPLIHLSSPSYHLPSSLRRHLPLPLCRCALNPVLSKWIRQSRALNPEAAFMCTCDCICQRGEEKVVLYSMKNSQLSNERWCFDEGGIKTGKCKTCGIHLNP